MCDGSMAEPVAWWLPTSRVCSIGRSTVPILSGTGRPGPDPKHPRSVLHVWLGALTGRVWLRSCTEWVGVGGLTGEVWP